MAKAKQQDAEQKKDYVVTVPFRVDYPNVFEARRNDMSGKDEYSICAIFPEDADLEPLNNACKQIMVEKFGADRKKWPKHFRLPIRKAEEKEKDGNLPKGYEPGMHFMNMKSKYRPQLVDQDMQDIIDPSDFYRGCWARASVKPYWYEMKGNKGIAFGLQALQKTDDDDSISNRPDIGAMFDQVERKENEKPDDEDPFADTSGEGDAGGDDMDDDIPF